MPAWAGDNAHSDKSTAVPGTVNYVEGKAYIGDQTLDHDAIGHTALQAGQSLTTETGKAEILLTPGVFLREGDNSAVKLDSAGLEDTEVSLSQGHAIIEVDELYPQNNLQVVEGNLTARLMKPGLYDFDLQQHELRVFDGEAIVRTGDQQIKVKGGRELMVAAGNSVQPRVATAVQEKSEKFDKKSENNDDLFRWSSLRSDYEAEANVDGARGLLADGFYGSGWGPSYFGAGFGGWGGYGGWYWDPFFSAYTFMPLGGIFYSPFGWGFYSPGYVNRAPFYGGHFYHTFNAANVRAWGPGQHYATSTAYTHGFYTGAGATRGGFHSGSGVTAHSSFAGGGFRGGSFSSGGFHGGGFSGGGRGR